MFIVHKVLTLSDLKRVRLKLGHASYLPKVSHALYFSDRVKIIIPHFTTVNN